jgi:ribonuclease HI
VRWHWVKGHSDHAENARADALANRGVTMVLESAAPWP